MRTLNWYIDTARKRHDLASDRALDKRLGFKGSAVSFWRVKKAWPREDSMVDLAELAGVPAEEAMLDLKRWSTSGKVAETWHRIAEHLQQTAAAIAFVTVGATAALGTAQNATHGIQQDQNDPVSAQAVYYGK